MIINNIWWSYLLVSFAMATILFGIPFFFRRSLFTFSLNISILLCILSIPPSETPFIRQTEHLTTSASAVEWTKPINCMSFENDKLSCLYSAKRGVEWKKKVLRGLFSVDPFFPYSFIQLSQIFWLIHIDCLLYANIYINDTPSTLWNNFGNGYAAIGLANLRSS